MFKRIAITAALLLSGPVQAAEVGQVKDVDFAHEGLFGTFDQLQLQRGLQIYTEVCSACHGLKYVPIRTLADEGGPQLPADQVRAYAAGLDSVVLQNGDERPREWTDNFPTRQGDGMGPDLSLMTKARAGFAGPYGLGYNQLTKGMGGPEYVYSLLTSYTGEEKEEGGSFFYENKAFPGGWISMSPPLSDGQVEFLDGSDNSLSSMAKDVASFLTWTAEPKLVDRKQAGFIAVVFLLVLAGLLYLTNKRLWAGIKGKHAQV